MEEFNFLDSLVLPVPRIFLSFLDRTLTTLLCMAASIEYMFLKYNFGRV